MDSPPPRRGRTGRWIRRFLVGCLFLLVVLAVGIGIRAGWVFRDRVPGYALDLRLPADGAPVVGPLRVGFARINITPDVTNPRKPVWLAGFSQGRAATAVHDDLWALAAVIDNGHVRIALVALDAIGFFHDDVVRVRRQVPEAWGVDYVVVASTHNHSTPDLMGLWGPDILHPGVDPDYRESVISAAATAVGDAVRALAPARMSAHELPLEAAGLVSDTRLPEVFDPDLRVLHFTDPDDGRTLGSIVGWANHPETPWAGNTEITADFPGFLRDALADGIEVDGELRLPGLGGTHVFFNGAVGGLMTTHPSTTVRDPFLDRDFSTPSHAKSVAVGRRLARHILDRLLVADAAGAGSVAIGVRARTVELPLDNPNFLLAPMLGLLDRGHVRWGWMRTEVAVITVGEATLACVPGEIYPELVNGGVIRAAGGDFDVEPVEVPPLREMLPGRVKFVLGLANDEIGYIIPRSQWDTEPPHTLHGGKRPYGEVNSLGPDTAPRLHEAFRGLVDGWPVSGAEP